MKAKQTRMRCNLREIVFGFNLASKPVPFQLRRFLQHLNTRGLTVVRGRAEVGMRVADGMRDRISTA